MSGIGKSTLGQLIYFSLNKSNNKILWFHEEESNHPINILNRDELCRNKEFKKYTTLILKNWKNCFQTESPYSTYIFESQLLLNFIGVLLWFGCEYANLENLFNNFSKLTKKENIQILYLTPDNTSKVLENVFYSRGKDWENWYFDFFNHSAYSQRHNVVNLTGLSKFWDEVYSTGTKLFKKNNCKLNCFTLNDIDFVNRNNSVLKYLNLKNESTITKSDTCKEYCGYYKEKDGSISCNVKLDRELLKCDFIWSNLELIKKNNCDEFYIKSFPHELKFHRKNQVIDRIEIVGKDISGLKGKILYKI